MDQLLQYSDESDLRIVNIIINLYINKYALNYILLRGVLWYQYMLILVLTEQHHTLIVECLVTVNYASPFVQLLQ